MSSIKKKHSEFKKSFYKYLSSFQILSLYILDCHETQNPKSTYMKAQAKKRQKQCTMYKYPIRNNIYNFS